MGEILNSAKIPYLIFRPEICLSLIRRELNKNLTTSGVFSAMKAENIGEILKIGDRTVESNENSLWIVRKDRFFDTASQYEEYVNYVESNFTF